MVPSASVLPSVKVQIRAVQSGVNAAVGAWFPGAPSHGDLTLVVIGRAFVVGDASG